MRTPRRPVRPRSPVQTIIDQVRRDWLSDPKKHAAIQKRAERVKQVDGRMKTLIRCEHCQQLFRREDIEANHKKPVGPLTSTRREDVEAYKARMFCRVAELEALCKSCHRKHTRQYLAELRESKQCKLPTSSSLCTQISIRQTAPSSASASL